ncbi:MAG TPA: integrase arm-type DNA-binding domain-containing protein, partial [Candidatus Acidoferrales bacterium]
MAKKLTDAFVRSATRAGITWDAATTGLGLKVLAGSGDDAKKVWVMSLRWPGRKAQTRKNVGVFPAMTLEAARERARELYAQAKAGVDLFAVEEEQRAARERERAAKTKNTFAAVAEDYIEGRTNRRAEQDAREIRRMLVAEWGARPIGDITPRDVRQLFERLKKHSAFDARNGWGHASGIFKWATHSELIEVSPLASLDRRLVFQGAKVAPRQRVLDDDEVFAFWRASGRLGYPAGPIYRLLLLTGCRVSEIAAARWSELHPELRKVLREAARRDERVDWSVVPDEHKTLTVPRERFKSDAEHVVQLTDAACEVLEGVPRLAGSDFIFTSNGSSPLWLGAKHKARLDALMLRTLRALARRRGDDGSRVRLDP